MNNTQNKRILQVAKTTLIVGIDVASEIHYARVFDNRGIEQAKVFKFTNNPENFEAFAKWLDAVKIKARKEYPNRHGADRPLLVQPGSTPENEWPKNSIGQHICRETQQGA